MDEKLRILLCEDDENLLLKPDTTLLDQTVSLETYEDYVAQAYSNGHMFTYIILKLKGQILKD